MNPPGGRFDLDRGWRPPPFIEPLLVVTLLLAGSGCDQSFEPLQPSERYFSIFGTLDASAGIQWIRVTSVRESFATSPQSAPAVVTLQHLETGRTVTLNDSLFTYGVNNLDLTQRRHAYNFWTTETIEPGATYHVVATQPGGASSSSTVPIPKEVGEVVVEINPSNMSGHVSFGGVDHLAMVLVLHRVGPDCPYHSDPLATYQPLPPPASSGQYRVPVSRTPREQIRCPVLEQEIRIVPSGAPWAFDPGSSEEVVMLPDVMSNVENGLGFLGGVATKTLPFERCTMAGTPAPGEVCVLRYDDQSARFEGTVWEQVCGESPLNGVSITLAERGRDRIRSIVTREDGRFRIWALEEGVVYDLTIRSGGFVDFGRTISFEAGEQVTLDIALRRGNPSITC